MGTKISLGAVPRPLRELAAATLFGGAYFLAAELTRGFQTTDPALLWVPGGLYIAVLLVCNRSSWPLLVCAALAASFGSNLLADNSPVVSLAFAVPSAAEGFLGALVVMRVAQGRFSLGRLADVAALVVGAAVLAAGITALSAAAADVQTFDVSFSESWLRWWGAHALGIVVIGPAVFAVLTSPLRLPTREQLPQVALVATGLAATVYFLSVAEPLGAAAVVACAIALPLLLWASLQWSPTAAALGAVPVALAVTYLAPNTADPLGLGTIPSAQLLVVQVSLGTVIVASLAFGAAVAERRAALGYGARRERTMRSVMNATPEAYVALDDAGLITEWSPRAQAVLGWTREEALGRRLYETFVPASGRTAWMAAVERRADAPDAVSTPSRITAVDKDGRELAAEVTISASAADDDNATHIFLTDVRERDRLRKALKTAEEHLAERTAEAERAEQDVRQLRGGLSRTSEELDRVRTEARRNLEDATREWDRLRSELTRAESEIEQAIRAAERRSADAIEAAERRSVAAVEAAERRSADAIEAAERTSAEAVEAAQQDKRELEEATQQLEGERERLERALDAMVMSFAEADRERMLLARRTTDLVVRYDRLGICRYASPASAALLGYDPDELLGEQGANLLHPDDRRHLGVARSAEADTTFSARLVRKDGELIRAVATISPIRDPESGRLVALEASLRRAAAEVDVSPRRRVSRARFDAAFGKAPIGMALLRQDGRIRRANAALCALTGYSRDQLEATGLARLLQTGERAALDDSLESVLAGKRAAHQSECGLVRADGREVPVQLSLSPVENRDGQPNELVAHLHDISADVGADAEPPRLSEHDPLTGLYSSERFEQELRNELEAAARYSTLGAVLVADLDGFTALNDLHGLARGDELIRNVANAFVRRLRSTDVAGRTARGQFAVLLRRASGAQASEVAEALLQAARGVGASENGGEPVELAASIGIATFGDGREVRAEELLVEAEIAVQDAKEAGGDRTATFDPAQERPAALSEGLGWAEQIRAAIEEDRFKLYAEPIVSLTDDRTLRYQLVPRMVSASGELIPAAAFQPAAERFGVAGELDRWILRAAIKVLEREDRSGPGIRVEVSLSTNAARDPELHSYLARELESADVKASGLCISVAEKTAVTGTDRTAHALRRLADLGCELGLDRFGAGLASFLHIERLPLGYIKLDGPLVDGVARGESALLVVKAITDVAHGLGMRTVAPDVLEHGTLRMLRELRVGYAQGPALALARPAEDLHHTPPPAVSQP